MTLLPEDWPRVKAVLDAALTLDRDARAAYVASACADDTALRAQVESLLVSQDSAEHFLETPAGELLNVRPAAADPLISLDVAVAHVSGRAHSLDIRTLLHGRLRNIVLITLAVFGVFYLLRFLRVDFTPAYIWRTMVPGAVYLTALAALSALLSRKRVYSVPQMRRLEVVFFATTTVFFAAEMFTMMFPGGWLALYAQRHPAEMSILARHPSLMFIMLIVSYGTFIPNTGRRCAAVVTLMALTPVCVIAAGALYMPIPSRLLFLFLAELTLWMAGAAAIAIYGSHKISVLREEALSARKLGQYQLKQRLGQGGMGEVYLAEHLLLRRPCALKVIRPERAGDAGVLQRFLREVQVTATLTHPNTVQVFDYGQADDGTLYYAMEYLTGITLEELVRRHGPLPVDRVLVVLRPLCGALAEAHAAGLIHRDIKPGNVMLCRRGGLHDVAKLLDFGLARLQIAGAAGEEAAGLTQAGLVFGTPAYMSPEQAAGTRDLDSRSDIYSLGALAHFLATGQPPFVRDTVVQTLAAHLEEPAAPLRALRSDFPEDLQAAILRCLAKDPAERFPDAATLDLALGACGAAGDWTQTDAAAWWTSREADQHAGDRRGPGSS